MRRGAVASLIPLLMVSALLVGACSTLGLEEATPTREAPRIEHCLADGRSLRFEAAVRTRIRQDLAEANQSTPFSMDAGAVRIQHSSGYSYSYEAEYRLTGRGSQVDIFATGTINARTCLAAVSSVQW